MSNYKRIESKVVANTKARSFESMLPRECACLCVSPQSSKKQWTPLVSRMLPLPSPRRSAALPLPRCRCRRLRRAAAAALTLQSHPAAEPDAEERAEHIRYTPSTNNDTAPQYFTKRFSFVFIFFKFLTSGAGLFRTRLTVRCWLEWQCGGAERGGRVPPAASVAPAEGAWSKQPFRRRDFLDVYARSVNTLKRPRWRCRCGELRGWRREEMLGVSWISEKG